MSHTTNQQIEPDERQSDTVYVDVVVVERNQNVALRDNKDNSCQVDVEVLGDFELFQFLKLHQRSCPDSMFQKL